MTSPLEDSSSAAAALLPAPSAARGAAAAAGDGLPLKLVPLLLPGFLREQSYFQPFLVQEVRNRYSLLTSSCA